MTTATRPNKSYILASLGFLGNRIFLRKCNSLLISLWDSKSPTGFPAGLFEVLGLEVPVVVCGRLVLAHNVA
jgi:hypothetical protein